MAVFDPKNITTLLDWLEEKVTPAEAEAIEAVVKNDAKVQATVAWLRTFLQVSHSAVLVDPPKQLFQPATAYFQAYAAGKQEPSLWHRAVATLMSDSWQRPLLAGVRHAEWQTTPRQLVYHAETADIALHIQPNQEHKTFDLIGQIFAPETKDVAAFTVQLLLQEKEVANSHPTHVGKFTYTHLPQGAYTIVILGDEQEITLPETNLPH